MRTVSNLITLLGARTLSVLGFFFLPLVMAQDDFRSYVLYFSVWQILSQLIGIQLGATFFRYGLDRKYAGTIGALVARIQRAALLAAPLFLLAVACQLYLVAALVMSLQFALFTAYGDYARSFQPEHRVFRLQLVPGFLYLAITALCLAGGAEIYLQALVVLEWLSYLLLSHFLYRLIQARSRGGQTRSWRSLVRRIYGAWRKVSLPLIPNNIVWYLYFNAPQIVGYYLVSDSGQYNQQAILFRVVVALSTLSSTIVLVYQKKVVTLFEESLERYGRVKRRILCLVMPLSLVLVVLFAACLRLATSRGLFPLELPAQYRMVPGYLFGLSLLFWLFLAVFSLSHYFVAEKRMTIIAPSMIIGAVLYCIGISSGLSLELDFSFVSITSLIMSLSVTFLVRYVWLVSHGVKTRC